MRGTLLAQLGFEDKDLSTPLHDEICLWVYKNPKLIIDSVHRLRPGVGTDDIIKSVKIEEPSTRSTWNELKIIGYHDLLVEFQREFSDGIETIRLGVEVKTSIPSLGVLLRQIKTVGSSVVVCPDDRFSGVLKAQGFGFVKYPFALDQRQSGLF